MKKILLASAGLFALSMSAPAMAADLAARPYTKAPVPAAVYNWTGFYIGLNAGGGWSRNCWDLINVAGVAGGPINEGCHDATGALVGGQIGYRWQSANWVFGLEAQGDWAELKGSNLSLAAQMAGVTVNNTRTDAIGLFTGQVGYAWNNVLWYVKGGAAVTHDKYKSTLIVVGTELDNSSETRWGAAVGTGLEFAVAPNWSVAVEYDHLFMGKRDVAFPATLIVNSRIDTIKQDIDMATVRVNYRFGGPVVARY
jgi:outer membrane immunogenic protein